MRTEPILSMMLIFSSLSFSQERLEIVRVAGTEILGASVQENLGIWMDSAGDINGDDLADFVLGTNSSTFADFAYVVYGATEWPTTIDLAEHQKNFARVMNPDNEVPVAGLGDFNGDGFDDVLIGNINGSPNNVFYAGDARILYGTSDLPAEIDYRDLSLSGVFLKGYRVRGLLAYSVSRVGDVNGDGFDDAFMSDVSTSSFTEADAYLIYGGRNVPRELQTPDIGQYGVRIRHAYPQTGLSLSIAGPGDVNGDGYPDLLIGASADTYGDDYAFLIYGGTDLPNQIHTMSLEGLGVQISADPGQAFGRTVSGAGDANGDGFWDFMISEPGADEGGTVSTGRVYLIYGAPDLPAQFDVRDLGSLGMIVNGGEQDQILGQIMARGGDLNFDGHDDPIIGSFSRPVEAAPINVIWGGDQLSTPIRTRLSVLDRAEIDSTDIHVDIGSGVASIGDVNADGYDDLIIGERFASPLGRFSAGKAYVIFNRPGLFRSLQQKSDLNNDGTINHEDLFLFSEQWQEGE